MKKKKVFLILIGIILVILTIFVVMNSTVETEENAENMEITPGEEITEEQERQTIISLYYINTENSTLVPEARVIDAKDLLENPYKTLLEYLIEGPKNEKLESTIPKETRVNDVVRNGSMLTIDLSQEFISDKEKIELAVYAIVNTLTELNDVSSVKILIDGEEKENIEGTEINLKLSFSRKAI